ncbi:uncharacterized protein BO96DRAFT_438440 [Aspergillus niger CBS 101883]|uniref:Contig An01c0120, genomic contig n=2 Tax=Aspergillus niger TaxID=5061 RepID=A2Q8C8_ASPNC|nr:uncharacterized protein BO96DRAFT_438440 [Aspergillus niger CBS 101883]XP_059599597.1 uncharacterized protein An01g03880 [Aspergillus niger]PYH51935.1 hypothetical protein BO96DRAFT_438440 [Aspergillus niger CBS 101883]CAK36925.1 unnamed protein product [Aspergillus niger]
MIPPTALLGFFLRTFDCLSLLISSEFCLKWLFTLPASRSCSMTRRVASH